MKIDRIINTAPAGKRAATRGGSGTSGGFFQALAGVDTPSTSPLSGAAPPEIESLLVLQEVAGEPDSDARGRQRGEDLLDQLDKLRLSLLAGRLTVPAIQRLAKMAAAGQAQVRDPRLAEILGDIELRAAVELAKLGR